jgi:hypothetical protein
MRRGGGESAARGERASLPGVRLPAFFTIGTTMPFPFYEQALRQQVRQDLPYLHELVQP